MRVNYSNKYPNAFESEENKEVFKIWDYRGTFEMEGRKCYFDGGGAEEIDVGRDIFKEISEE